MKLEYQSQRGFPYPKWFFFPLLSHVEVPIPTCSPSVFPHASPSPLFLSVRTIVYFWRYRIFFCWCSKEKKKKQGQTHVYSITSHHGGEGGTTRLWLIPSLPSSLLPSTQLMSAFSSALSFVFKKRSSDQVAFDLFFFFFCREVTMTINN